MLKGRSNTHYSKQIHNTQIQEIYKEAIKLNVVYTNIHSYNIYSNQCNIDIIINELSLEALYKCIYVFDKYVTWIL